MSLKATWAGNPPFYKFLLSVGMIIVGLAIFTLAATFLISVIYGVSALELESMISDMEDPRALPILKLLQVISEIGTFIVPAIFLAWLFDNNAKSYLKLNKRLLPQSVFLVLLLFIASVPAINYLGELNSRPTLPEWLGGLVRAMRSSEEKAALLTEKFLEIGSPLELFYAVIIIGVLPAFGEELMFRGIFQRIFSEWSHNKHTGIWVSAILFSAMHMQFYGFVPRMLLGAMLGYLFLWSGSLWLPILSHFINNGAAVVASYLYKKDSIPVDPDTIGTGSDHATVWISMILTAAFLWMIYRTENLRKTKLSESAKSE